MRAWANAPQRIRITIVAWINNLNKLIMTEQRQKLIDRFQRWLDTNPRKQIIAAECATIAEEYAKEQLLLCGVSNRRELLIAYEKNHYTPQEWALVSEQCIKDIDNFLAIN